MEAEIIECFKLYYGYMREQLRLPELANDKIEKMTIDEIRTQVEVLYMRHVLISTRVVSKTSKGQTIYKHMKSLLNDYITLNKISTIDHNYMSLMERTTKAETNVEKLANKLKSTTTDEKKGWLF